MSETLYVARRAFKSRGVLYEVGEIIDDPASITLLRSRIQDRDVLELIPGDSRNAAWYDYLVARAQKPLDDRIAVMCGKVKPTAPTSATTPTPPSAPASAPAKAATMAPKAATTTTAAKPVTKAPTSTVKTTLKK